VGDSRLVGVEHNYPVIEGGAYVIGDLLSADSCYTEFTDMKIQDLVLCFVVRSLI